MRYKLFVQVVGFVVGLCGLLALTGSRCEGLDCQNVPTGGGQTMTATAKTLSTSCPVTNGMFVRNFTTLRLDSVATAFGQCQTMVPSCSVAGCTCVPGTVYERLIGRTLVWADVASDYLNGAFNIGTVYGKNPDGSTAFLHVLDSTQSNSTGPVDYLVGSAGEYLLHFQANINTTLCNILPAETPKFDMLVHVRTSLHRGERTNGALIGAANLPNSGAGYYYFPGADMPRTDNFGGVESTRRLIETVGMQWAQTHPTPRFGYGDISLQSGGQFLPHKEHQNGLDIDVRYIGNNGETGVDLMNTTDLTTVYNRSATIELLRLFAAQGSISRIIVDPNAGISSADVPNATIVLDECQKPDITQCRGHRDHFHISLTDPDGPDTNNCP